MSIPALGRRVAKLLTRQDVRLVFAESCTAGLVAASLSRIPGISKYLCGSMVTYREEEKTAWLGVSRQLLRKHTAVSEIVARRMVEGVLLRTTEAHLAASVTGHLGPNAPREFDGIAFIGISRRQPITGRLLTQITRYSCVEKLRMPRQREVVEEVLRLVAEALSPDSRQSS